VIRTRRAHWWRLLWRKPWLPLAAMALAGVVTVYFVLDARRTGSPGQGWAARRGFSPHEAWNPGPAIAPQSVKDPAAAPAQGGGPPPR